MMFQLMADAVSGVTPAAGGDGMTMSVAAITAIGVAVAAVLKAYKAGVQKGAATETTIKDPVPEVPVRKVYSPPTFSQHMEIARRVDALEADQRVLRREMAEGFIKLMQVGEERKDKIMEKIDDVAKGFHSRVDQIVKGPTRR